MKKHIGDMDLNQFNIIKEAIEKLNIQNDVKIKLKSINNCVILDFKSFVISFFESNYGYKQECTIRFKGYEIDMPITLIEKFKDLKYYKTIESGINELIEIVKINILDILETEKVPKWYLNYVRYVNFFKEVITILQQLELSDPLRVKWMNKDTNWKIDFKERFPGMDYSGSDFFWSIM